MSCAPSTMKSVSFDVSCDTVDLKPFSNCPYFLVWSVECFVVIALTLVLKRPSSMLETPFELSNETGTIRNRFTGLKPHCFESRKRETVVLRRRKGDGCFLPRGFCLSSHSTYHSCLNIQGTHEASRGWLRARQRKKEGPAWQEQSCFQRVQYVCHQQPVGCSLTPPFDDRE